MITLLLQRRAYMRRCTLSELSGPGLNLVTIEPEWNNNLMAGSCIPIGTYELERWESPRFGDVLLVHGCAPRKYIEFHPGNYRRDTSGCILPGLRFGMLEGEFCVERSRDAMQQLLALPREESLSLVIANTRAGVLERA